jgi:molybdopterin/thiamine biosynthesis adenylyltransferase/nitroreductase
MRFDYSEAFSRNLGWVTEAEQAILRSKRIAIAGLGGVGGSHLLTLARLGVGAFAIADLDRFELANFNRQAGASTDTLDRPKLDVLAGMARRINPEVDLRLFDSGVTAENLDAFLDGVDLYLDALDFFQLAVRRQVFAACEQRGIPAVTAAPLGMGAALLVFTADSMSFEDYFRLDGHDEDEQALRFMLGLAPARLQIPYLADDTRVDFAAKRGPSTPMACEICAGLAATTALKILLRRGPVITAPRGLHFDAYRNRLVRTWRPGGNRNPLQRLGLVIARRVVQGKTETIPPEPLPARPIERVLDLARWAPSGDNEQPWRFEVVDDSSLVIHCSDTRDWCVYDLDGTSSQIAVGALLETMAIAASAEGMRAEFERDADSPETALRYHVRLTPSSDTAPDPLLDFIRPRATQRRPLSTQALTAAQKAAMEKSVGEGYRVIWLEGAQQRRRMAKLLFHNAHIRLTTPEAFRVHQRNIEWGRRFSEDRIPEQAVGVDALTGKIMRWALQSWTRVRFLNRFLAGTWLPRLQMDLRAGLCCAGHFVIVADRPLTDVDDYVAGGRAMQRFWLEATRQGLQFQPEMTPLIFARYVARGLRFTEVEREQRLAGELAAQLDDILGPDQDALRRVYMGRVGLGPYPRSRSLRRPREQLVDAAKLETPA